MPKQAKFTSGCTSGAARSGQAVPSPIPADVWRNICIWKFGKPVSTVQLQRKLEKVGNKSRRATVAELKPFGLHEDQDPEAPMTVQDLLDWLADSKSAVKEYGHFGAEQLGFWVEGLSNTKLARVHYPAKVARGVGIQSLIKLYEAGRLVAIPANVAPKWTSRSLTIHAD